MLLSAKMALDLQAKTEKRTSAYQEYQQKQ